MYSACGGVSDLKCIQDILSIALFQDQNGYDSSTALPFRVCMKFNTLKMAAEPKHRTDKAPRGRLVALTLEVTRYATSFVIPIKLYQQLRRELM